MNTAGELAPDGQTTLSVAELPAANAMPTATFMAVLFGQAKVDLCVQWECYSFSTISHANCACFPSKHESLYQDEAKPDGLFS